jgi:hypothetical protein
MKGEESEHVYTTFIPTIERRRRGFRRQRRFRQGG